MTTLNEVFNQIKSADELTAEHIEFIKKETIAKIVDSDSSALCFAVELGKTKIINQLLELGAEVNPKSDENGIPLLSAINSKDADIVKLMLDKGADVNSKTKSGNSALALAINSEDIKIVQMILAKNPSFESVDVYGLYSARALGGNQQIPTLVYMHYQTKLQAIMPDLMNCYYQFVDANYSDRIKLLNEVVTAASAKSKEVNIPSTTLFAAANSLDKQYGKSAFISSNNMRRGALSASGLLCVLGIASMLSQVSQVENLFNKVKTLGVAFGAFKNLAQKLGKNPMLAGCLLLVSGVAMSAITCAHSKAKKEKFANDFMRELANCNKARSFAM